MLCKHVLDIAKAFPPRANTRTAFACLSYLWMLLLNSDKEMGIQDFHLLLWKINIVLKNWTPNNFNNFSSLGRIKLAQAAVHYKSLNASSSWSAVDQVFTLVWINSRKIFADTGNLFPLEHKIQQETPKNLE